jgi:hypothetical protein
MKVSAHAFCKSLNAHTLIEIVGKKFKPFVNFPFA